MEEQFSHDQILRLFPEAAWISDMTLRQKTLEAIADSYLQGGWTMETLNDIPVSVSKVHTKKLLNGILHVRSVVQIATFIYDTLERNYSMKSGVRDTIIAGALLHDLGKPIEFTLFDDGKVGYSQKSNIMRHPLSGAILAAKHDIDPEIIHIIATHSFEGDHSYKTLAAQIVCAADNIAFAYLLSFN